MIKGKRIKGFTTILIFFFLIVSNKIFSQSFGFGFLGLAGFYGGYTYQEFDADGLNKQIERNLLNAGLIPNKAEFGLAKGYRVGANIFRAKFSGYFITLKGFYQFLQENHKYNYNIGNLKNNYREYDLQMNYWGVSLDFELPLLSFIDFKLIEGGINFYQPKLIVKTRTSNNSLNQVNFSNKKLHIGYFVGSGLILQLIPNYISIEGTIAYNYIKKINLYGTNNKLFYTLGNKDFTYGKNFSATVQLNISMPL